MSHNAWCEKGWGRGPKIDAGRGPGVFSTATHDVVIVSEILIAATQRIPLRS